MPPSPTPPGAPLLLRVTDKRAAAPVLSPQERPSAPLRLLPVRALRLDAPVAERLRRLGLKRIGQLYDLPRTPLTARFSDHLITRLGQALGTLSEPLIFLAPPPAFHQDLKSPDPILTLAAIEAALDPLTERLCAGLEKKGQGAQRFELTLFRLDK